MQIKAGRCVMRVMKSRDIGILVGCVAACQVAGLIGSMFTTPAIPTWYETLQQPGFTPPNAVFMPVWLTLYALMGVAIFLIWRKGLSDSDVRIAFILFWGQLVLNIMWSVVFFGFRSILGGMIIIIALWALLLIIIMRFFRISRVAGGLMVPYIVWISIAASLNSWIWVLNP